MKLFCAILAVYLVALTLHGVDGRGGSTRGLRETLATSMRARRHTLHPTGANLPASEDTPQPQFRTRRSAAVMDHQLDMAGEEPAPPQFRPRRQMPPPPEGMPAPPPGMPPPPQGMPAPPSY